ncbi:alpha-L-fucosidase [Streptomyces sp. NPDC057340]|uniref:alpha-L-fucosidase n=1 Tax=Streptomyces sp. NPDC057340 TaxID=3346103 RepID=UPI0036458D63
MAMQPWFNEAKLGIFVHYGIYSVDGVAESWALFDHVVPHEQYMRQLDRFTASAFDATAWAGLFARAGAGYAVLTARHHDGVALWDTQLSDLNVVRRTPAGRDLIAEYVSAMRDKGLKAGLYYSHSDWNHPDYASVRHPLPPHPELVDSPYVSPAPGAQDPRAWDRFLGYRDGQVRELLTRFEPDLLWFDGEWERSAEQWRMSELAQVIRDLAPHTVCNSRLLGHGDYATPEQGLPISAPETDWELCLTVNDSWGHRPHDVNHKSVGQLVRYFAQTAGMGGNLLLGVGPRADGTIDPEQAQRLEGLGNWIRRHSAAVHGSVAGLPPGHHYGPSTLSPDRRTLFLVCFDPPGETVCVRGLRNTVRRVSVLGTGTELAHRRTGGLHDVPGDLWIDAPAPADLAPHGTVLALELDGELELYTGRGRD